MEDFVGEGEVVEAGATEEGSVADHFDVFGERDIREFGATVEGVVVDSREACWYRGDGGEVSEGFECVVGDNYYLAVIVEFHGHGVGLEIVSERIGFVGVHLAPCAGGEDGEGVGGGVVGPAGAGEFGGGGGEGVGGGVDVVAGAGG